MLQLIWAIDFLVVNNRVGPVKALEVLAAVFQDLALEFAAITEFVWISAVDHPVSADLNALQGWLPRLNLGAGVVKTLRREIISWRGNVKVILAVASRVGRRAGVGGFEHHGASANFASWHVCIGGQLVTFTAASWKPAATNNGLRHGSATIELCTILVALGCWKHGVGVAVSVPALWSIAATASTTATVPVPRRGSPLGLNRGE